MTTRILCVGVLLACLGACSGSPSFSEEQQAFQAEAQAFLDGYQSEFQRLYEWASNTRIVEGDATNVERTRAANEAMAAYTGSAINIRAARRFLERRADLTRLQVLALERVLYAAAANPRSDSRTRSLSGNNSYSPETMATLGRG